MKFEYDEAIYNREVVAELYYVVGGLSNSKEKALCIRTNDENKYIWLYEDGDITIQPRGFYEDPIKKFYEGDTITITF